jgi:hypothetical protein
MSWIVARGSIENGAGVSIGTEGCGGDPAGAVTAEEQMVTRVGLEPTTPGLKVPFEGDFAEQDEE